MIDLALTLGLMTSTPQEDEYIQLRLTELSPKESLILNAAINADPLTTAAGFINLTHQLNDYELYYPAGNDQELGEYAARYLEKVQESAYGYLDMEKLGRLYREQHPGVFYKNAYVLLPGHTMKPVYDGSNLSDLTDEGYRVKLKLVSVSNKEGVWLKLPDYAEVNDGRPDELRIALDALEAPSLRDCRAVEAVCVLPGISGLLEQYDALDDLVRDSSNLGYVLDEAGQGERGWHENFMAALEYEGCDRLDFALDISQNLHCYDFLPDDTIELYGREQAKGNGVVRPDSLSAEIFDYASYGRRQAEDTGRRLTEHGYIARNHEEFCYEYSEAPGPVLSM